MDYPNLAKKYKKKYKKLRHLLKGGQRYHNLSSRINKLEVLIKTNQNIKKEGNDGYYYDKAHPAKHNPHYHIYKGNDGIHLKIFIKGSGSSTKLRLSDPYCLKSQALGKKCELSIDGNLLDGTYEVVINRITQIIETAKDEWDSNKNLVSPLIILSEMMYKDHICYLIRQVIIPGPDKPLSYELLQSDRDNIKANLTVFINKLSKTDPPLLPSLDSIMIVLRNPKLDIENLFLELGLSSINSDRDNFQESYPLHSSEELKKIKEMKKMKEKKKIEKEDKRREIMEFERLKGDLSGYRERAEQLNRDKSTANENLKDYHVAYFNSLHDNVVDDVNKNMATKGFLKIAANMHRYPDQYKSTLHTTQDFPMPYKPGDIKKINRDTKHELRDKCFRYIDCDPNKFTNQNYFDSHTNKGEKTENYYEGKITDNSKPIFYNYAPTLSQSINWPNRISPHDFCKYMGCDKCSRRKVSKDGIQYSCTPDDTVMWKLDSDSGDSGDSENNHLYDLLSSSDSDNESIDASYDWDRDYQDDEDFHKGPPQDDSTDSIFHTDIHGDIDKIERRRRASETMRKFVVRERKNREAAHQAEQERYSGELWEQTSLEEAVKWLHYQDKGLNQNSKIKDLRTSLIKANNERIDHEQKRWFDNPPKAGELAKLFSGLN